MIFQKHRFAALSWIAALTACLSLCLVASAQAAGESIKQFGRVTVYFPESFSNPVSEKNLRFSKQLQADAKQIMATQRKSIERAYSSLRNRGAVRVKVLYGKPWNDLPLTLFKYSDKTAFVLWQLVGYSASGKVLGKTPVFPTDPGSDANFLTRPTSNDCSLLEYNLFDPRTWFQNKTCSVKSPPAKEFLRVALGDYLLKSDFGIGGWELQQLKFALEPGHSISIQDGYLVCPDLAKYFGGATRIPLSAKESLGGYSFKVDLKARTAVFKYVGPDQQMMADRAKKIPGQPWIYFGN
jgi:hypothetical protein